MRRADRLLQIIQIMRRAGGQPISAGSMAEELEVSVRTVYRDMVSLESTGVPVRGEAGVGYILDNGYDMPPLMFTASELEALMLGARLVDGRVDSELSRAARDAVSKIATAIPDHLREALVDVPYFAPHIGPRVQASDLVSPLRLALKDQSQVSIFYLDKDGARTERIVWPIALSFFDASTILAAWCTLREDFRAFRLDRIEALEILDLSLPKPRKTLLFEWRRHQRSQEWPGRENGEIFGVL